MAGEVRARMVEGAVQLLAQRGLQATSFSEVLELTGAPRGSIYHHFPSGKDQLVGEAVDFAGDRALAVLEALAGSTPEQVTTAFLALWRRLLEYTNFQTGCAVVAVTVATDSGDLLDHAGTVFRAWRSRLASLFEAGGLDVANATAFAALLVASSEGAVVLSRAEKSIEPFDLVESMLLGQVRAFS